MSPNLHADSRASHWPVRYLVIQSDAVFRALHLLIVSCHFALRCIHDDAFTPDYFCAVLSDFVLFFLTTQKTCSHFLLISPSQSDPLSQVLLCSLSPQFAFLSGPDMLLGNATVVPYLCLTSAHSVMMIAAGYLGAVALVPTVKWLWFLIGLVVYIPVLYALIRVFRQTVIGESCLQAACLPCPPANPHRQDSPASGFLP